MDNDMALAEGIGIIPPHLRNQGYTKLGFEPGEGGIRIDQAAKPAAGASAADLGEVLAAAIDAGADPAQMAASLRGDRRAERAATRKRAA